MGASDYGMSRGKSETSKVHRFRLRNGEPVVVQTNNVVPRMWLLAAHDDAILRRLGQCTHYSADDGRNHHLQQVREFNGRELVKVTLTANMATLRDTINTIATA